MAYPAESPVIAVHIKRTGEHYEIHLRRDNGEMSRVHGANVTGGLRRPGDVLTQLLAQGVPMDDATHCVQELEPGFDARTDVVQRPEVDAAASRQAGREAGRVRREELKSQFRRDRPS